MTILICSGTQFSNWRKTLKIQLSASVFRYAVSAEIAKLGDEICREQFSESDELDWKPFSPNNKYKNKARRLLSSIENESLFCCANDSISLCLDFWKTAAKDAKFVLFYSSPESELNNYISTHSYKLSHIEKVINAWIIRTRAMLIFFMNNRDRCLLIDVQDVDSSNSSFMEALNDQFDFNLETIPSITPHKDNNSVLIKYLATALLLRNHHVSKLYDDVQSAATLIGDLDKSISNIEDRNKLLIDAFLKEVTTYQKLNDKQSRLETDLYLNQLQISQMQVELEFYFNESIKQETVADTVAEYSRNDPLLRIVRQVRQM